MQRAILLFQELLLSPEFAFFSFSYSLFRHSTVGTLDILVVFNVCFEQGLLVLNDSMLFSHPLFELSRSRLGINVGIVNENSNFWKLFNS